MEKKILGSNKLRLSLLTTLLRQDEILLLGNKMGIQSQDLPVVAAEIASINFGNNPRTLVFLESIGLDESYLPDTFVAEKEDTIEILEPQNHFFEQLDYQYDIRRRLIKYFRELKSARCILHMPTGAGKTKTAMHIIGELYQNDFGGKGSVLWLAHSEELLNQAIDAFKNHWRVLGKKPVSLVRLWGDHNLENGIPQNSIIFGGIQKLQSIHSRNPELLAEVSDALNLIVVDECHKGPSF